MAPSFMKKTMVYLGLLDDEYDEYDDLEDRAPRGFSAATSRVEARPAAPEYDQVPAEEFSGGMSRVRTIPRESAVPAQPKAAAATVAAPPEPGAGHAGRHHHHPVGAPTLGDGVGPGARGRPLALRRRQGDRRPPQGQSARSS